MLGLISVLVATLVDEQLRPALRDLGLPILDVGDLSPSQRDFLARYCMDSVEPRDFWPDGPGWPMPPGPGRWLGTWGFCRWRWRWRRQRR